MMESPQSLHAETKLTSSHNSSHISDPQNIVSEHGNKDNNVSLDANLQKDVDNFPNIDLLNQSQKNELDHKSILSNKFSEQLSITTESHDIDILDDIPPLENITEEVEDIGVIVTDLDLDITHEPKQKINSPHTQHILDGHNENNIAITNSESIPIEMKKEPEIIIQKEKSTITEDTTSVQNTTIPTETIENTKDTDIESKKAIENSNISSITSDISSLPDIDTTSDLKALDVNADMEKSIDKTSKENLQQLSNENINKKETHEDIDMRMKQEDVDAMNLELSTNLGDDDFPKLYDFDTKDNDDIFSSHDILEGSIQRKKELNVNNTQTLKENNVPELSTSTDGKLQEANRTDLSIFKYGLNTSLSLPKTDDINDKVNIDDSPLLSDDQINNELITFSKFNGEQSSNTSTMASPSLNNNEKSTDLQNITKENSLSLDVVNNGTSDIKIRHAENENQTVNKSDGSLQIYQDTLDKGENRNTPASIISEKNNLLYRKRKNSLIPGAFYPSSISGYALNPVQSANSNNNTITAEIRSGLPLEGTSIVSNDSVNDASIPKIEPNSKLKGELLPEIPKEQPTIFAYARLDFQSFTFYVQTLHAVIGRRSENDTTHKVDVNLGPSKSISRRHAQIFYNFGTGRFELSIIGKNGAFVDDVFIERGNTVPLHNKTKIQIGQIPFQFVLPEKDEQKQQNSIVEDKKETKETTKEPNTTQVSESKPKSKPHNKTDAKTKEPKKKATKISKPAKKEPKEKEKKIPKPPKKVYTLEEIPLEYRTKPPFSYSAMLTTCIRKYSSEQGMSLSEIYEGIRELYPYYKYCPDGWQSSVRHNLSLNKSFRKVCKKGKGWLWGLDEAYIAEREKIKQKQAEAAKAKAQAAQLKLQQQNVAKGSRTIVADGKKQVKANISQTLSANRSGKNGALTINKQSAPSQTPKGNDTQRTMKFLQEQLIIMTRDRKGLDKPTIAIILTQALAMTINQVTQAAKSQGIKGNPLTALMDKNPQHLNLILSAAVNAATAKVTKGKVKQLVDPSVLQEINAKTSISDHSNIKKNKISVKVEKDANNIKQTTSLTKQSSKSNSSNSTSKLNTTTSSSSVSTQTSAVSTPSAPSGGFDPTSLSRFFQPKNQNNRTITSSISSSTNHNRSAAVLKTSLKRPHGNSNTKEKNKRFKPNNDSGDSNDSSDSDTSDSSDSSDTSDSTDLSDASSDNMSDSDSCSNNDTDSDSSDNDSAKSVNNHKKNTNSQEQKVAIERISVNENNEVIKENSNKENNRDNEQRSTNLDQILDNKEQEHMTEDKNIESKNFEGNEDNKNAGSENKQVPINEASDGIPEPIKEKASTASEESIEPTESNPNEQLNSEKKKVEAAQHNE